MTRLLQDGPARSALQRPDATALMMRGEVLTYGQLEATANRLARMLRDQGCVKGDRVCLLLPKSPTAIVALLAVLKADCVYVPLDPASPAARVARIVEAVQPRCILTAGAVGPLLQELVGATRQLGYRVGDLGGPSEPRTTDCPAFVRSDVDLFSPTPLDCRSVETDAAHILFTSGSTGQPKGVVITHRNVLRFVEWAHGYFQTAPEDRISGHPPLHFDLSTFDIFGTLGAGAALHLVPPEIGLMPTGLADFIRQARLTQWFSVPSALGYMAKFDVVRTGDFPDLKRLLWCGEVLPTPVLQYWMARLPHVTFTNLYGPTEATIASSYHTVPESPREAAAPIPIGTPCAGEELAVLDEELRPVPVGEIGQLFISGVGLSPGYWRDPAQTAAAFLPHPAKPGERLYRTGDLGRLGRDGLFYYVGRADSQVKSRGYRIELGEIEAAVNALNLVRECAVVAVETGGFEGVAICCAYVPGEAPVSPAGLRQALARLLPSYMLPARWSALAGLPKNANGKTDRPRLRERFQNPEPNSERNLERGTPNPEPNPEPRTPNLEPQSV
jgi:amino acid adenylation domain-containing protein